MTLIPLVAQFVRNLAAETRTAIYFDNNATTPLDPRVARRMAKVQRSHFGNPSSLHRFGVAAREIVEHSRRCAAGCIGADPAEIVFTSGGTEGNNTVIKSIARSHTHGHFITSGIEHPSVMTVFRSLETQGFDVTYLGVGDDGRVRVNDLAAAIRPDTLLISIMHVNNELGTIQPIEEIAHLAFSKRIPFHCDAVQSFGKLPLDVRTLPITYLTFTAHKINGPKGVGAIYVRAGTVLDPLLEGGHQERMLRAGTEAVAAIAGFGEACTLIASGDATKLLGNAEAMRRILTEGITAVFPDARINGAAGHALPTTLNVTLPGIPNSELLAYLDFHKIAVSVGSACVAGSDELSHVLAALGIGDDAIRSSFRISTGRFNTEKEARSFVGVLARFAHERTSFFSYIMPGDLLFKDCRDGTIIVADIRDDDQRGAYPPIPSALRLDRTMKQLKTLPQDKEVVLVCEDGYLSNLYSVRLRQAGWKQVRSLWGGYKSWRQYHRDDYYYHIMKDPQ